MKGREKIMKKIYLLLCILCCFILISCGDDEIETIYITETESVSETEETQPSNEDHKSTEEQAHSSNEENESTTDIPQDYEALDREAAEAFYRRQTFFDHTEQMSSENMAEVFMQHRAELVFESEEEEAFIDRFMAWNKADNIGRKAVFYQGRREAEPYIDALTEEEKQELLDNAKKEYRSIDPDENVFSFVSYDGIQYQCIIKGRKLDPGQIAVINVKKEVELGEGAYMSFTYIRQPSDGSFYLYDYGY